VKSNNDSQDDTEISNEINENSYGHEDYQKMSDYYDDVISNNFSITPANFNIISARYPKSVYAITGGWRAGKTSASGMLVTILRKNISHSSETYHDTFNFGNVNESISSFFNTLAIKTSISEFKQLAKVSTPRFDMKFSFGPISIDRPVANDISANTIRRRIFEKLTSANKKHLVIIDDIDRLLPEEQIQWLRVIELLGKFNNQLIVIIPINIDQIKQGLNELGIPGSYLQKILPEQIPVGVDIDFIKSQFNITSRTSDSIKRKYSKYMLSLVIRMAMSKMSSNAIKSHREWENDFGVGNFSSVALRIYRAIKFNPTRDENRGIEALRVNPTETIWTDDNKKEFSATIFAQVIANAFKNLPRTGERDTEISRSDINLLRSILTLNAIFKDFKISVAGRSSSAEERESLEWHDIWTKIMWEALKDAKTDPHLSEYFQYDLISDEISILKSLRTPKEENEILKALIMEWGDQNIY